MQRLQRLFSRKFLLKILTKTCSCRICVTHNFLFCLVVKHLFSILNYEFVETVHALSSVDRCVRMRVFKHGFDKEYFVIDTEDILSRLHSLILTPGGLGESYASRVCITLQSNSLNPPSSSPPRV